jgi:hypothetical protein
MGIIQRDGLINPRPDPDTAGHGAAGGLPAIFINEYQE